MDPQKITEDLIATAPKSGVFVMTDEAGNSIGDVTNFVVRLLKASGGWLEPNEIRASLFLSRGKEETRIVGTEINAAYGFGGMTVVHGIIDELLPEDAAAELEAAWSGIGEWQA